MLRFVSRITCLVSLTTLLHASPPDISNLAGCIADVRNANANPPAVQTFDPYVADYHRLISDLQLATPHLPYLYQEAAAKPLIAFLQNLGEQRFLQIFNSAPTDQQSAALQQILPDAALALLIYDTQVTQGVNAFEEVVSDLYNSFLADEYRINRRDPHPIPQPTYGVIPPLVKFGNQNAGPYTWPADTTSQILGLKCAIVSLPPSQLNGGVLAWSALGHETGGHDVTHADKGLLNELAAKIHNAVLAKYHSPALANYWARCVDEASADALGYLNVGPSLGIALIGYFRALGDGKLRTVGSVNDTHPIDLLRGYFGAAIVKRLSFKNAADWSQAILNETEKDNGPLYLVTQSGIYRPFPVPFAEAVDSADLVAQVIIQSKLITLNGHSFQQLEDWKDSDQAIADELIPVIQSGSPEPSNLPEPGLYAAYVVAAATQAGLQAGADLTSVFANMQALLASMHHKDPIWSTVPTPEAQALLDRVANGYEDHQGKHIARYDVPQPEQVEQLAVR